MSLGRHVQPLPASFDPVREDPTQLQARSQRASASLATAGSVKLIARLQWTHFLQIKLSRGGYPCVCCFVDPANEVGGCEGSSSPESLFPFLDCQVHGKHLSAFVCPCQPVLQSVACIVSIRAATGNLSFGQPEKLYTQHGVYL